MLAAGLPGGSTGRAWLLPTPLCLSFPYTSSTQNTTDGSWLTQTNRSKLPMRQHPPHLSHHPIPTSVLAPPPLNPSISPSAGRSAGRVPH